MATINLITDVAQHQVATIGFDASVCRREDSMCAVVLDADTPVVVTDARIDPRFQDNPFVTGAIGHVRWLVERALNGSERMAVLIDDVGNAAKFRVPGRTPVVVVDARCRGAAWRIEIVDNGPGVPEAERERVFEPLARASSSVDGSGIGLATCRRVVEAHGGRIGLAEARGGGTVAWFELPD